MSRMVRLARNALLGLVGLAGGLWPSAAAAQAAPAPAPAARPAVSCRTASPSALAAVLPRNLAQPIMPAPRPLPAGDEGVVVLAGNIPMSDPTRQPEFRLFAAPRVVRYDALADGFPERHPISVERGAVGAPKDSYSIHFVPPRFHQTQTVQLGPNNRFAINHNRSLFVVACDGDRVAAWAADAVRFASPDAAHFWAAIFVLIVYAVTGFIVYHRRLTTAQEDNDDHKLYRIAKVQKWSLLRCLNPIVMTADVFDRGSLPKFQILFFVLLVAYGLAYLAIWRGELSDISASIVYLLGIPALGTLGAQAVQTTRDRLSSENWAWLVSRRVLPMNDPGSHVGPRFSDLIMSDSELDLYKLQAVTFSAIVGFSMLVSGPTGLAKFEVPQTLLEILGLSQIVFVGGRLAKPTTLGDVDKLITELRSREIVLRRAASTGVDVDENGKPLPTLAATRPAKPPATLEAAAAIVPTAVQRYLDVASQVQVLLEAMAHRSVNGDTLSNPKLA